MFIQSHSTNRREPVTMVRKIKNKVVVITGGSRGIGYAIAEAFLREDAKAVVILDINEVEGEKAARNLTTYGAERAVFYKCDVTKDLDATFKVIVDKFETIDVLVNNAGIMDESSLQRTLAVNTVATVEWSMKFWEHMRRDKGGNGGTIVNMASIYGYKIDPFCTFYKASKYAVMGFTNTLGHSFNYEKSGVRVIAMCPGFTVTNLLDGELATENQQYLLEEIDSIKTKSHWQSAEVVGEATVEVFKTSDSGKAWVIENGNPVTEIVYPAEFYPQW